MSQTAINHPLPTALQAFVQGKLLGDAATAIEQHLESCAECCSALATMNDDPWLSSWVSSAEPGTIPESPSEVSQGKLPTIPGYEIQRELGRGGMGVVYQARHLRLNRVVALKVVIGGAFAQPGMLVRLRAEAEVAAQLQHPHIVQIHEIGDHEGKPYLALEYVPGGTLDQFIRGTPQAPTESARLLSALARAMAQAHQRGIVHRDLKPANVLISLESADTSGERTTQAFSPLSDVIPKITDFGLAKWREHDQGLTATGVVAGTPSYMAPEQAQGLTQVGAAADIYALGVILYELLTGKPPFKGATPIDTLAMVVSDAPLPPHRLQPRIPRDLETICLKCLHKEPGRRYLSAEELADDLDRWRNGEAIHARPVSNVEKAWLWAKRRPAISGLLAGIALITILGVLGILWQWTQAELHRTQAELNEQSALKAQAATQEALVQADRSGYFTRIARISLEWLMNHDVVSAVSLLQQCRPRTGEQDLRGWEWEFLRRMVYSERLTFRQHAGDFVTDAVFSPDGEQIASTAYFPFTIRPGATRLVELFLWNAATGQGSLTVKIPAVSIHRIAYSPNGKWLATAGHGGVQLWDRSELSQPRWTIPGDRPLYHLLFSPNSNHLAWCDDLGTIVLAEPATGVTTSFWQPRSKVRGVAFSADDTRLAACISFKTRYAWVLWDIDTRQEVVRHEADGEIEQAAFDAQLTKIAVVDRGMRLHDFHSGKLLQVMTGHLGPTGSIAFHPDGQTLASGGSDRTVRLWNVQTGEERNIFRGHAGRVSTVRFDAAGQRLVSGAHQPPEVIVWDLERPPAGQRTYRVPGKHDNTEALAFDSTGRRLLAVYPGGLINQIDVMTGKVAAQKAELSTTWQSPAIRAAFHVNEAGADLAVVAQDDPLKISLWKVPGAPSQVPGSMPLPLPEFQTKLTGHKLVVYQMVYSGNGRLLATAGLDRDAEPPRREIIVWDMETKQQVARFDPTPARIAGFQGALAISQDGRWLAFDDFASGAGLIQLVDLRTKQTVRLLSGHTARITSLAFSADDRRLASADIAEQLKLWDLTTGKALPVTLRGPRYSLAFSPDSQRLAAVDRQQIKLWDAITGHEIMTLRGQPPGGGDPGFNPCITWSKDGRLLAASNYDVTVTIWEGGEPVRE